MEDLWVTLIQTDIYWHEIEANLAGLARKTTLKGAKLSACPLAVLLT